VRTIPRETSSRNLPPVATNFSSTVIITLEQGKCFHFCRKLANELFVNSERFFPLSEKWTKIEKGCREKERNEEEWHATSSYLEVGCSKVESLQELAKCKLASMITQLKLLPQVVRSSLESVGKLD